VSAAGRSDRPRSSFEPVGVEARYRRPQATIHPDASRHWWRRIFPLIATRKWSFLLAIGLSFVSLVLAVVVPNLLNGAIDRSIFHHQVPLHHYVEWIAGIGVACGVASLVSRWLLFRTAYDFEFDLRNLLYEHLSSMSFSFFDRSQTGQLISRANSDIRSVQMYATFAPMIIVQCAIGLVAFGFMLSISVPLALVAMVTMPFLFVAGMKMRNLMFPISWIIQARLADVATIVDENVNGVRVVRSFAQENQELDDLATASAGVVWAYEQDADMRARYTPAIQNLPQVGLALVLLVGGWMVFHGHLGIGAILAFNAYLLMLQAPFMMLGQLIMMGQRAAASAQRIFEVLDEHPEITEAPDAVELHRAEGRVDFDHVRFGYADGPDVLSDFDLHVRPSERVALVGATGSGKSTVARLLLRFYDLRQGAVRIDGHDVAGLTLASLRAHVGVVTDEPFLFSASIAANIAYGRPDASRDEVVQAARAANAHEFILGLSEGYDTVVGERGYTLSGGQRQRIAIARELLMNPPVLILDDATSAIDVHVEAQIHEALEHLLEHRTTIIIAHRLSTIALADRVALLEGGRVVATGTHEELLATSPAYAEVLAHVADDLAAPSEELGAR
jgi:ATP-binding cassette, subfamily B, bacterial